MQNFGRGEPLMPPRVQEMEAAHTLITDSTEGDIHRHPNQVKLRLPYGQLEAALHLEQPLLLVARPVL